MARYFTNYKIILLASILVMNSCEKEIVKRNPVIYSLSSESGFLGGKLIINGADFVPDKSKTLVYFESRPVQLDSATSTQLFLKIPNGLSPSLINITVTVEKSKSNVLPFTIIKTYKVVTIAGNGKLGHADGNGLSATFVQPESVTMDSQSNLFVADNFVIRKIDASANVTTYAGSLGYGHEDGPIGVAKFNQRIRGIVSHPDGSIFISDKRFVRKVDPTGNVTTLCGDRNGSVFNALSGITLNNNQLFVVDIGQIKKVDLSGTVSTLTGDGNFGSVDGPLSSAKIVPYNITSDRVGNLLFTEFSFGNKIRRVTSVEVSTLPLKFKSSLLAGGIAIDSDGNIFTAYENSIIKINKSGNIETIAGKEYGFEDGNNTDARFANPTGLVVDAVGNIYVCDTFNNRIRKIIPIN